VITAFGAVAAVATLASLAALVRVHQLPTGYRPVRNAVSDYGVGRYSRYYRFQAAALALAAVFVVLALARAVDPAPIGPIVLLVVFAAARLAIAWFPTDLDRLRPTTAGRIHLVLAGIAFVTVAWAAAALPDRVDWPAIEGLLKGLGWFVVLSAVACALALTRALRVRTAPWFGAIERTFYAAVLAWFFVVSLHFL
jgi:hypothetical membrane protein